MYKESVEQETNEKIPESMEQETNEKIFEAGLIMGIPAAKQHKQNIETKFEVTPEMFQNSKKLLQNYRTQFISSNPKQVTTNLYEHAKILLNLLKESEFNPEDFKIAKLIIELYENEKARSAGLKTEAFKIDLEEYFETVFLDDTIKIEQFELTDSGEIVFIRPWIDCNYKGLNDIDIKNLAEKHGVKFKIASFCYQSKAKIANLQLTESTFVKILEAHEKQWNLDRENSKLLENTLNTLFTNGTNYIIGYNNKAIQDGIIEFLESLFQDTGGWIEYFVYELDYGKDYTPKSVFDETGKPIDLSTSAKLFNFLIDELENKKEKGN